MTDADLRLAEQVRTACLAAALDAYEDAGLRGLCAEGRWECAIDALRALPLNDLVSRPDSTPVGGSGAGE
ncbi:MAG: hypothetical protein WBC44_12595 [Planctomycetaceae bacterium]